MKLDSLFIKSSNTQNLKVLSNKDRKGTTFNILLKPGVLGMSCEHVVKVA